MPEADLINRMENWGRAMRSSPVRLTAQSFEGHYRSPQPWEPAPVRNRHGIDLQDAQTIESAITTIPIFNHALARSWYVYGHAPALCLRLAARAAHQTRPRSYQFGQHLEHTHTLISHALTIPLAIRQKTLRLTLRKSIGLA